MSPLRSLYNQYLNCRGDASPHRDLGVPPSKFERWMITQKRPTNPAEYSTKFQEKIDFEGKTL